MTDLEFVKAYLAKHVELLGDRGARSLVSCQMKFAHLGRVDEDCMAPTRRWFSDDEMGAGKRRPGWAHGQGGLNKDPVTIFVYGFVRDNLELFRKDNGPQAT